MRCLKFTTLLFSGFFLIANFTKAQTNCDNGALATLGILYLTTYSDSDDKSYFATNKYGISDLLIEKLGIPVDEMEIGDYRVVRTGGAETLFYKETDGLLRPLDIIVKADQYYLLSPKAREDICDYKANTMLFIPSKQYLKYVETPFSFSLRKDLAKKLNEQLDIEIDPKAYGRFCEMLSDIKNRTENH